MRGLAPLVPLVLGFALGAAILRERVVDVTFQEGGRAFRGGDGAPHRLPATLTLDGDGRLWLRVVNLDKRSHAVGVLSVEPGDSVEVRPDMCAPAPRQGAVVLLVQ